MNPTFPITIEYFGREIQINPDPMVPFWVAGLRSGLGLLGITDLGLLTLAIGWPATEPAPWSMSEVLVLEALQRDYNRSEDILAQADKLGRTEADRQQLRREMRSLHGQIQEARAALKAATIQDIPADITTRSAAAARVRVALVTAGVPAPVVASWASTMVAACSSSSDAGFVEWAKMEATGFLTAPAGTPSSGASESPSATPATPSDGSL
jgi:hypothetical protein